MASAWWHGSMLLAAFFVEPQLPAGALGAKILDAQGERGTDPREGGKRRGIDL